MIRTRSAAQGFEVGAIGRRRRRRGVCRRLKILLQAAATCARCTGGASKVYAGSDNFVAGEVCAGGGVCVWLCTQAQARCAQMRCGAGDTFVCRRGEVCVQAAAVGCGGAAALLFLLLCVGFVIFVMIMKPRVGSHCSELLTVHNSISSCICKYFLSFGCYAAYYRGAHPEQRTGAGKKTPKNTIRAEK